MTQEMTCGSNPRIISIATENPGRRYAQREIPDLFGVTDKKLVKLFSGHHISSRYLTIPSPDVSGMVPPESGLDLANKHRELAISAGSAAAERAIQAAGLKTCDVDYIACITSTGFLCPGLSAHLTKALGLRPDVHRLDIVGMGCNAGLNGMQPLVNYLNHQRQGHALLVCAEICSASYVFDATMRTAVVNSLFGDGVAAAIMGFNTNPDRLVGPEILGFVSHILTDQIDSMRFDYDDGKYSFFLERDIPYVIGENAHLPVRALLKKFDLHQRDISHWIVHSGGKKVIDAIKFGLGISSHALRHTDGVLQDLGNLSSGSFLFSHERLLAEKIARAGDYAIMMTMGPGMTIECCLARF
ncbi:putative naringenin-chalcone synthase [Rhizobium sp. BK650]|uniref:3,5-dihydroxyphenylacetyl-CoA synthase DpgA n=1 Tax=Rhizobium sp. BK650 TaxID=2586990 RepID=UPI001622730D|nr:3,5-dihydroxyphenylacetyl-CoA synthase DpgA [Rhizobium sp. BK650]MBB3660991.1 putative naringenin-chalcone synthase [Rhizobium sp. BK650]